MLKTTSSVTNAIGALNYKGSWNASTNTPTLTSGVGVKGDYYVVSVAGSTNLDGTTIWSIGDWAVFNGTIWQKVDGSVNETFQSITILGQSNLGNVVTANVTVSANATFQTSSLPLVPLGYLEITLNGTVVKIPYYSV